MKCPQCEAKRKYKEGMTCACGYQFVLDPKQDKMTDGKFLAIIGGASGNDTYFFTENQLYTQFCRRQYSSPKGWLIAGMGLLGLAVGMALLVRRDPGTVIAMFCGIGAVISLVVGIVLAVSGPADRSALARHLRKWQERNGPLEKLITEPGLHQPPPEWPEPDIYDYGVERLLIVERDIVVDLLVRNGFHAENSVLVVSENGYPDYLLGPAAKALAANPDLPVFLLHDATDHGVVMTGRMQGLGMLRGGSQAPIDLGLFPDDVRRMGKLEALRPGKLDYKLPVDSLLYATLSLGLAQAFDQQVSLGTLLAAGTVGGGDDGIGGFG